jgi:hypothetical protein
LELSSPIIFSKTGKPKAPEFSNQVQKKAGFFNGMNQQQNQPINRAQYTHGILNNPFFIIPFVSYEENPSVSGKKATKLPRHINI